MYANIIVDADISGISHPYTYKVPSNLEEVINVGACVAVPFGGRKLVGYVFELTDTAPGISNIKDILAVVPDTYVFDPSLLNIISWMSDYYVAPLAHSMRAIIPETMSATINSVVRLIDAEKKSDKSPAQIKIVEELIELGGATDLEVLKAKCNIDNFNAVLRQLNNRGCLETIQSLELPKARPMIVQGLMLNNINDANIDSNSITPAQNAILKELMQTKGIIKQSTLLKRAGTSVSPIKTLIEKGMVKKVDIEVRRRSFEIDNDSCEKPELTASQKDVLSIINGSGEFSSSNKTLIYGVTGSGKTEVYLQSVENALNQGKSSICLVPEISLTTHLMKSYISRFGDQVAILHSKLSVGEKYDEWRRIESGEAQVVLGARSAVFAPVSNLGLIVVDEEHETSYKQDRSPRYNAKRIAETRIDMEDAAMILGSATPSIESFYRASSGDIKLAVMDKRINDRALASVQCIDQREEFEQGRRNIFSEPLKDAIADRLARKQQVILFVNRRGYAHFMLCRSCGHTEKCPNCEVSLTYHAYSKTLKCHHCSETRRAPESCPNCGSTHFKQFGIGTERIEEEVRKLFPEAGVIRMDADTTRRKNSHAKLLDLFHEQKADILVGTQMVAKGLDFHNVTLVGVISADTILNLPDFRAAERTFQLLTQVSGRAGRGDLPGEVFIQSFSPDHYAIRSAIKQDYLSFYGQEIQFRRELMYPPFTQLINVISNDPSPNYALERLSEFAKRLQNNVKTGINIMGPVPAPVSKLKGVYRSHLMIRSQIPTDMTLQKSIAKVLDSMPSADRSSIIVDVDPLSML